MSFVTRQWKVTRCTTASDHCGLVECFLALRPWSEDTDCIDFAAVRAASVFSCTDIQSTILLLLFCHPLSLHMCIGASPAGMLGTRHQHWYCGYKRYAQRQYLRPRHIRVFTQMVAMPISSHTLQLQHHKHFSTEANVELKLQALKNCAQLEQN